MTAVSVAAGVSQFNDQPAAMYNRMFPRLTPATPRGVREAEKLGLPGGRMDGGPTTDKQDNKNVPAGFAVFGQFVTHDVAADMTPMPDHAILPEGLTSFRSPRFDLDNVYGGGPGVMPALYAKADHRTKFLIPDGGHDMPRGLDGAIVAPDARDDNNMPLAQLHLAFMRFHNAVVDALTAGEITTSAGDGLAAFPGNDGATADPNASLGGLLRTDAYWNRLFEQAQRIVVWHYQWIVLHEYLPLVCGQDLVDDVLTNGPRHYKPGRHPYIPVEFATGAFRYAHAVIRSEYQVNDGHTFPMFSTAPDVPGMERVDLRGGPVKPEHAIDWRYFFHVDRDHKPQYERLIGTTMSGPILELPVSSVPGAKADALSKPMSSMAMRDLCRSEVHQLPSGQDIARAMAVEPLTDEQLGFDGPCPLLWYVLREAEVLADGHHLGPVGGRIVAETIIGLLRADPFSIRPSWKPTLAGDDGDFTMAHLLRFAA
ncbi:peroxidase family protein [Amycolatopsis sp. DSM 110486]|uniref:peroxidase family protein n=1 Tax=Amycolatopsis sp. DSM 110486 TaxID=2865832 RepID=UPI001C6A51E5|nr:peroxidase family protein [Amycolatopsis sp. DSM 110486]QYN17459.1 hypothetical protein K1T34_32245 [Amycolatopsis sp. DSM 110486]